jgi:Zn-dependent metalloprotease
MKKYTVIDCQFNENGYPVYGVQVNYTKKANKKVAEYIDGALNAEDFPTVEKVLAYTAAITLTLSAIVHAVMRIG